MTGGCTIMFIKKINSSTALGHDPASTGNQKLMKLLCDMLIKGVVYPESNYKTTSPSIIDPQLSRFLWTLLYAQASCQKYEMWVTGPTVSISRDTFYIQ